MRRFIPILALACATAAQAESIGAVDTVFKFIGPDHKIVVEAYDDPKVNGVTCYLSRAKTGGDQGGARTRGGSVRSVDRLQADRADLHCAGAA